MNSHVPQYAEFVTGGDPPVILEREPFGNIFWLGGNPANGVGTYATTITVTPEPTTVLGICGVVGGFVAAYRRKANSRQSYS